MRHLLLLYVAVACAAQAIELKTATTSPMQYYIALPEGWSAAKHWPVVMVVESARRDFRLAADEYVKARGSMPFIIAVPMVVTGGGASYRQAPGYRYSEDDWGRIEKAGGCAFDDDGIAAVAADVRRSYGGEEKYFLAGWEAGGHTVFAEVFRHPERLRAAALAGPNYAARCVEFSSDQARAALPVKVFLSGMAADVAPNRFVHTQSQRAKEEGEQHGFRGITLQEVAKPHGPMPDEVMAWFLTVGQTSPPVR